MPQIRSRTLVQSRRGFGAHGFGAGDRLLGDGDLGAHAGTSCKVTRRFRWIRARAAKPIRANKPHGEQDHGDQDHGHRRTQRPVLRHQELVGHHPTHHVALRATQDGCGDVVTRQRDEHQQRAGDDARHREGDRHLSHRLPAAGTQVLGCFTQGRFQAVERHEQRQDHQRQVVVDDAELHGELRVEHGEWSVPDADRLEHARTPAPQGRAGSASRSCGPGSWSRTARSPGPAAALATSGSPGPRASTRRGIRSPGTGRSPGSRSAACS